MKNFVLFLRANENMPSDAFVHPNEISERIKWLQNIQDKDLVVNLGGIMPPIPTMASTLYANNLIKEGVFTEGLHFLTGFIIIKAKNINEAQKISSTNPILKAGGSVEIREIILR